jgi:hypothetical protein
MYAMNFGSRTILNNQGTINLNVQDVFNTRKRRMKTYGEDFYREAEMQLCQEQLCSLSHTDLRKNMLTKRK